MGLRTFTAAAYARAAHMLLPPGRVFGELGPTLRAVFFANGDELARVSQRSADLLRESDPRTTDELLPDFEEELDLVASGTKDDRRARVVARIVRRQRFRPADFQDVLAPIFGLDPADVEVIETSRADAVAMEDDTTIFRFFCYRDPALAGDYDIDAAQEEIDRMKPSHTEGHAIESKAMIVDDEHSLVDRDLIGA